MDNTLIFVCQEGDVIADWIANIAFNQKSPIYQQLILQIKQAIASGVLKDGFELPSRRALAARLGINPMTVQKAYQIMSNEGILVTSPNAVSHIKVDLLQQQSIRRELIDREVSHFIGQVKALDLNFKEVIEWITTHWDLRV